MRNAKISWRVGNSSASMDIYIMNMTEHLSISGNDVISRTTKSFYPNRASTSKLEFLVACTSLEDSDRFAALVRNWMEKSMIGLTQRLTPIILRSQEGIQPMVIESAIRVHNTTGKVLWPYLITARKTQAADLPPDQISRLDSSVVNRPNNTTLSNLLRRSALAAGQR